MRVLLAGGGTAGHINPALAIAGFIKQKKPDTEFLFVGNKGGMEETLVPQAGYDMKFIVISGFSRKLSPKGLVDNVKTVKRTITSSIDAKKIIKEFKPDICIGTGGYVSGPVIRAAAKLGVDERPVVLSFGGSLGARKINEGVADLIARSGIDGRYQHIHAYGKFGKWFPDLLKEKGCDLEKADNLDIREFINDMDVCMAAADLVICRAGAITLSEIQALGKPAILIPSPNVAENHQYHNAMALVNAGAADIIEEKDLTGRLLMQKADNMLANPERLAEYAKNARKTAITDANERIYSVIKGVLGLV